MPGSRRRSPGTGRGRCSGPGRTPRAQRPGAGVDKSQSRPPRNDGQRGGRGGLNYPHYSRCSTPPSKVYCSIYQIVTRGPGLGIEDVGEPDPSKNGLRGFRQSGMRKLLSSQPQASRLFGFRASFSLPPYRFTLRHTTQPSPPPESRRMASEHPRPRPPPPDERWRPLPAVADDVPAVLHLGGVVRTRASTTSRSSGSTPTGSSRSIFGAFNVGALVALFFSTQFADRKFAAEKFLAFSHLVGGLAILGLFFIRRAGDEASRHRSGRSSC